MVACHLGSYLTVIIHRLDALQHVAMNTQPSQRLPKLLARYTVVGALQIHKAAEQLPFLVLYLLTMKICSVMSGWRQDSAGRKPAWTSDRRSCVIVN